MQYYSLSIYHVSFNIKHMASNQSINIEICIDQKIFAYWV